MSGLTSLDARAAEALGEGSEEVLRFWFPDGEHIDHETMLKRGTALRGYRSRAGGGPHRERFARAASDTRALGVAGARAS